MSKKQFRTIGGVCVRKHSRGETLYTRLTVTDPLLIQYVKVVCERTGKSSSKVLKEFAEGAFAAGYDLK